MEYITLKDKSKDLEKLLGYKRTTSRTTEYGNDIVKKILSGDYTYPSDLIEPRYTVVESEFDKYLNIYLWTKKQRRNPKTKKRIKKKKKRKKSD